MQTEEKVIMAKKGDDNTFYDLIQQRKEMLYRTAYLYVKNDQDALDIVGETVYKAYLSIKNLKHPGYFNTWITRILINCALNHIKKTKKELPLEEPLYKTRPAASGDREAIIDLYSALDQLNDRYKTVIIFKYFQDMTLSQIAEVMQHPLGTVKTYLHKALKELRSNIHLKEVI